jgi:hypothetical protein
MNGLVGLLLAAVLVPAGLGQTDPSLHQRSTPAQQSPAPADKTDFEKGYSTLPDNASGEYVVDGDGSVVQITIDHGLLSGYVTKMEQGSSLTLFFQHTSIHGSRISFTTKTVHGLFYSFSGDVVRGEKKMSPAEPGFYRLAGEWTEHLDSGVETERVSLKSTPRD